MKKAKIKAKITIAIGKDKIDAISGSLSPDNMPNMEVEIIDDGVVTYFTTEKLGSLIATLDDYLMNVKVALDVCELLGDL